MSRGRLMLPLCFILLGTFAQAQAGHAVTVRLLSGKTGSPVKGVTFYEVDSSSRFNPRRTNKLGEAQLAPESLKSELHLSIGENIVGCDSAHLPYPSQIRVSRERVLAEGFVGPNECGAARSSPMPGVIIIFVRQLSLGERFRRDWDW